MTTRTQLLTRAQHAALRLVASGYTSQQAADELGCSRAAVDQRMKDAMTALNADSRAHAVAIALCLRLIDPDEVWIPETTSQRARGAAA